MEKRSSQATASMEQIGSPEAADEGQAPHDEHDDTRQAPYSLDPADVASPAGASPPGYRAPGHPGDLRARTGATASSAGCAGAAGITAPGHVPPAHRSSSRAAPPGPITRPEVAPLGVTLTAPIPAVQDAAEGALALTVERAGRTATGTGRGRGPLLREQPAGTTRSQAASATVEGAAMGAASGQLGQTEEPYPEEDDAATPERRGRHKGLVCAVRGCNKYARLTDANVRKFCILHMRQMGLNPKTYDNYPKRQGGSAAAVAIGSRGGAAAGPSRSGFPSGAGPQHPTQDPHRDQAPATGCQAGDDGRLPAEVPPLLGDYGQTRMLPLASYDSYLGFAQAEADAAAAAFSAYGRDSFTRGERYGLGSGSGSGRAEEDTGFGSLEYALEAGLSHRGRAALHAVPPALAVEGGQEAEPRAISARAAALALRRLDRSASAPPRPAEAQGEGVAGYEAGPDSFEDAVKRSAGDLLRLARAGGAEGRQTACGPSAAAVELPGGLRLIPLDVRTGPPMSTQSIAGAALAAAGGLHLPFVPSRASAGADITAAGPFLDSRLPQEARATIGQSAIAAASTPPADSRVRGTVVSDPWESAPTTDDAAGFRQAGAKRPRSGGDQQPVPQSMHSEPYAAGPAAAHAGGGGAALGVRVGALAAQLRGRGGVPAALPLPLPLLDVGASEAGGLNPHDMFVLQLRQALFEQRQPQHPPPSDPRRDGCAGAGAGTAMRTAQEVVPGVAQAARGTGKQEEELELEEEEGEAAVAAAEALRAPGAQPVDDVHPAEHLAHDNLSLLTFVASMLGPAAGAQDRPSAAPTERPAERPLTAQRGRLGGADMAPLPPPLPPLPPPPPPGYVRTLYQLPDGRILPGEQARMDVGDAELVAALTRASGWLAPAGSDASGSRSDDGNDVCYAAAAAPATAAAAAAAAAGGERQQHIGAGDEGAAGRDDAWCIAPTPPRSSGGVTGFPTGHGRMLLLHPQAGPGGSAGLALRGGALPSSGQEQRHSALTASMVPTAVPRHQPPPQPRPPPQPVGSSAAQRPRLMPLPAAAGAGIPQPNPPLGLASWAADPPRPPSVPRPPSLHLTQLGPGPISASSPQPGAEAYRSAARELWSGPAGDPAHGGLGGEGADVISLAGGAPTRSSWRPATAPQLLPAGRQAGLRQPRSEGEGEDGDAPGGGRGGRGGSGGVEGPPRVFARRTSDSDLARLNPPLPQHPALQLRAPSAVRSQQQLRGSRPGPSPGYHTATLLQRALGAAAPPGSGIGAEGAGEGAARALGPSAGASTLRRRGPGGAPQEPPPPSPV